MATMRYLVLLLLACGGSPAAPFLGTWRGSQSTTVTPSVAGSPSRTIGSMTVEVTFAEDLGTGDVDFGACQHGTPNGNQLVVRMLKSPCVVTSGDCSLALTTTTGTVTVRDRSMTMDYAGSYRLTCPAMADEMGTFSVHGNLTKT